MWRAVGVGGPSGPSEWGRSSPRPGLQNLWPGGGRCLAQIPGGGQWTLGAGVGRWTPEVGCPELGRRTRAGTAQCQGREEHAEPGGRQWEDPRKAEATEPSCPGDLGPASSTSSGTWSRWLNPLLSQPAPSPQPHHTKDQGAPPAWPQCPALSLIPPDLCQIPRTFAVSSPPICPLPASLSFPSPLCLASFPISSHQWGSP